MFWLIAGIAAIVLFVLIAVYYWNRIIVLENRIDNSWSQIDVQLKRRADLVPNLVNTVKGYLKHERGVFKEVTEARSAWMKAGGVNDKIKAGNQLASALKTILAVAENYPQLRASENFTKLQEELSSIENKIAYARQFYNDSILDYNTLFTTFPGNFFASLFNKQRKDYLQIPEVSRKVPKVSF